MRRFAFPIVVLAAVLVGHFTAATRPVTLAASPATTAAATTAPAKPRYSVLYQLVNPVKGTSLWRGDAYPAGTSAEDVLERMDGAGWDLVSVTADPSSQEDQVRAYYFKRR